MAMFNFDFSPEAQLRKERAKIELEALRNSENKRYSDALKSQEREAEVGQGMAEIYRLKENASRLRIEATLAEQEGQKRFASMDPESGRFFGAASGLNTQAEYMEKLVQQRGNELRLKLSEGNPKLQMQVLSEIMLASGVDPSTAEEPKVKVKMKRAGSSFGDDTEVSYDVPASMAKDFISGTGSAPLPSTPRNREDSNNMMSLFQSASGTGISPYSTGEQPIDQSMLFSGQSQQVAPQAAAQNPFTQAPSATQLPEGKIVIQNGKRYRIVNGQPQPVN
jgi:hypothetical protein